MISVEIKKAVTAATVRFPGRGGHGVLVPGGLILTAAHVVHWSFNGGMALGDSGEFVQEIEAGGRQLLVYPLAVEPVADLAVLGALDAQWNTDAAGAFERFREGTRAVPLATAELAVSRPVPAYVLAHTGRWLAGRVTQACPKAERLWLEVDGLIQGGTSGSPVVTDTGLLLGVVSNSSSVGRSASGLIPRPHLVAPVWLARQMTKRGVR